MSSGFYRRNAWWLGTGILFTFGSAFGQTYVIALFSGPIMAEFDLSDGEWGAIFSAATLGTAALLPFIGRLVDVMPLVRVAVGVLLVYAVSAFLMGLAAGPWTLLLAVFGLRVCGQGMMSHIALTAMARWFARNRGRAVAVAMLGWPISETIYPLLAAAFLVTTGWRLPWFFASAIILLGFLPLAIYLLRQGRTPQSEDSFQARAGMGGREWTRGEAVRHWSFWAVLPGMVATPLIVTSAFFHQAHIAEMRDYSLAMIALGFPLFAAVSTAATFIAGPLSDRFGPMRLLPFVLLPMIAGLVAITAEGGVGQWFLLLGLAAVTVGINDVMQGVVWPTLYGTRHIGAVRSLAGSISVLATAISPVATGLLIDAGIPFTAQTGAFAILCVALSFAFSLVAPRLELLLRPAPAQPDVIDALRIAPGPVDPLRSAPVVTPERAAAAPSAE
jgi:MFS family permease